jgi:hypothetical protein
MRSGQPKEISMKRRFALALAAGALVTAIVPGAVSAGDPIGGCPSGWGADWSLILPIHQPQAADHNGDGWLCRRDLPSDNGGPFGGGFTFRDNVLEPETLAPLRKLGGAASAWRSRPSPFLPAPKSDGAVSGGISAFVRFGAGANR